MDLKLAYTLLKEKYYKYELAVYQESRAKPRYKKKYQVEVKSIENEVWQIFQSCPELNDFVPYPGEFFTSFFGRDFSVLMHNLEERLKAEA